MAGWFSRRDQPKASAMEGTIERYRRHRAVRSLAGFAIAKDFSAINAAIVDVRGGGKWMRVAARKNLVIPLPDALVSACRAVATGEESTLDAMVAGADLAEACCDCFERLLADARVSVDDLLAISIDEPGIRWREFDGKQEYVALLQPQRVAEKTGVSVIDSLRSADVSGGGRGEPLEPLVYWLMFADRSAQVSHKERWLIRLDDQCELWRLPPSDGLDAELPALDFLRLPGLARISEILQATTSQEEVSKERVVAVLSHGEEWKPNGDPRAWLDSLTHLFVEGHDLSSSVPDEASLPRISRPDVVSSRSTANDSAAEYMESVSSFLNGSSLENTIDALSRALMLRISSVLKAELEAGDRGVELIVSAEQPLCSRLQHNLAKTCPNAELISLSDLGFEESSLSAVAAGVLGVMHIDQMPASVPWLTGCLIPRIHGRITPGRPAHWRRLVIEMADYHPPAMKLRDAI